MRREEGAEWTYNGGQPDPHNPWVDYPYVTQARADGHATVPEIHLRIALDNQRAGYLREKLAQSGDRTLDRGPQFRAARPVDLPPASERSAPRT